MRLISILLIHLIVLWGSPVFAGQSEEIGDALSMKSFQRFASVEVAAESQDAFATQSAWPNGPLERLLVQQTIDEMGEGAADQSALDSQIAELQRERSQIGIGGPRAATIVGAVFTGVGAVLALAAYLACQSADNQSGTECNRSNAEALEIGGGVLAGVGIVTLIVGATTLQQRKASRSEIGQRIMKLQKQRSAMSQRLGAHVRLGETKGLTVSWKF